MEKQSNESVNSKTNPDLIDEMVKDSVIHVGSSEFPWIGIGVIMKKSEKGIRG